MKRFYLPIFIVIFLIVVAGLVFYSLKPKTGPNEAALIINYGESKRVFAGPAIEGMTILDALMASAKAGNFDFDYQGGILKRIGQFEENEKKWKVFLNGREIKEPLEKTLIKARDKIKLKLE